MTMPDKSTWTKPAPPAPTQCPCGETIGAIYVEPFFFTDLAGRNRPVLGTGCWEPRKLCVACVEKAARAAQAAKTAALQRAHDARVQTAIDGAGFRAVEMAMGIGGLKVPAETAEALHGWVRGEKALYLYGKQTGTGKTYAAVSALKRWITQTGQRGLFRPVPMLIKDLRQAVGRFKDGAMIDELTAAPALVLDDIGVESPSGKVLEAMYMLIDDWYAKQRPQLIITSNLSLDELSGHLDDRIASRIAKLCRVIEITGSDRRLPGFEGVK